MADSGQSRLHRPALAVPTHIGMANAGGDFSPLEWSVIRLAAVDDLSTLRAPGPLRRFWNWLMGRTGSVGLASPHLEALRRMAVLSWHFGFSVPAEAIADFLSAGFSLDQYDLLAGRIRAASTARQRTQP